MTTKYFFVRSPQAFWLSPARGVLGTLVTSVVLFSLTRATLTSPGQDETRVCGYICIYIYIVNARKGIKQIKTQNLSQLF